MIRVLIVDDNELVRLSVAKAIGQGDRMVVVGECADGAEVLEAAAAVDPDVVIMDASMPVMSGFEATRLLTSQRPAVAVLMFSASGSGHDFSRAAAAGAAGYLVKDGNNDTLRSAVRIVGDGGAVWPGDNPPS